MAVGVGTNKGKLASQGEDEESYPLNFGIGGCRIEEDDMDQTKGDDVAKCWSDKLRNAVGARLANIGPTLGRPRPSNVDFDTDSRGFDIADFIEAGLAREICSDFTTPLRRSGKLWRFRVMRSADRLHHRLMAENGEFLLYAKTSVEQRRVSIYMYDPNRDNDTALYNEKHPAFTLMFNEKHTEWNLYQEQCENCQLAPWHMTCAEYGKQHLAVIRHHRANVGDGISNIMEMRIPGIYNNGKAMIWCPVTGHGDLNKNLGESHETQLLITRQPAWNDQVSSLVLDFKGRNVMASAKNFQLCLRQKPEHVLCQFGKLSDTNFGLDFKFPLSVAQTFAAAMSTMFWT